MKALYYFIIALLFIFSCKQVDDPIETEAQWIITGEVGEFNFVTALSSDQLLVPTATYTASSNGINGYLYYNSSGSLIHQEEKFQGNFELKGTTFHNEAYYTLCKSEITPTSFEYRITNTKDNQIIRLSSLPALDSIVWEDLYFPDDTTLIIIGQTSGNQGELTCVKLQLSDSLQETAFHKFSETDKQVARDLLPLPNDQYLVIYEDNKNGYTERDIAFKVLDYDLKTIDSSVLNLTGYQEYGGAVVDGNQLYLSGHTDDQEPNHDFMLARFILTPAPQLQEVLRYGGSTHDGSTCMAANTDYFALVGISNENGASTTCIKVIDRATLKQVSDKYLPNENENYPNWAEIINGYIYIAGYEIGIDTKKHTLLARQKLE